MDSSAQKADLTKMTAWDLRHLIQSRKVSPRDITAAVLARIDRLNPGINAFVTQYPERALAASEASERAVMAGEAKGLLHGIPVSIKDTYWTKGTRTTIGSRLLANFVPGEDAPAVERLARAGAIDIGKTNVPEFAWRGSTDSPMFGTTVNPWNKSRTSGGSSGGSAAAVAAGMAPLALSGDGAGSTRIPASFCGVVGLKPTRGRVAISPPAGSNELLVHAGPITRTIRDTALMLTALSGPDRRDPLSLPNEGEDFVKDLDAGVRGVRMAWSATLGFAPVECETREIAERAARTFAELGATLEEAPLTIADPSWILDGSFGANAAGVHGNRPAEEKALMDPALVAYAEAGRHRTIGDYVKVVAARQAIVRQLVDFFETYDLLLTPTVGLPAFANGIVAPTEVAGQPVTHLSWSTGYIFNWSGQPAISIPAGMTADGLPVGLQIVGRRLEETLVLRAAAALEEARPWAHLWPDLD